MWVYARIYPWFIRDSVYFYLRGGKAFPVMTLFYATFVVLLMIKNMDMDVTEHERLKFYT